MRQVMKDQGVPVKETANTLLGLSSSVGTNSWMSSPLDRWIYQSVLRLPQDSNSHGASKSFLNCHLHIPHEWQQLFLKWQSWLFTFRSSDARGHAACVHVLSFEKIQTGGDILLPQLKTITKEPENLLLLSWAGKDNPLHLTKLVPNSFHCHG